MNEKPLVSVIIPTYKRPDKIMKSIESVYEQTYSNIEIIIVDDNKKDSQYNKKTKNNLDKYTGYDNFTYIQNESNLGASASRNKGIIVSRGEYIAFLDDDDIWKKNKMEKQINAFKKLSDEYGVIYCKFVRHRFDERVIIPRDDIKKREGYIFKELIKGNFIGTPTVLIKKDCLKKSGLFDEKLPALEDWELWLRLSKHYKFKIIDQVLVEVYFSKASKSTRSVEVAMAREMLLNKYYNDFNDNLKSKLYFSIGQTFNLNENTKKGRAYIKRAIKCNFRLKYLIVLLLSFLKPSIYSYIFDLWSNIKKSR